MTSCEGGGVNALQYFSHPRKGGKRAAAFMFSLDCFPGLKGTHGIEIHQVISGFFLPICADLLKSTCTLSVKFSEANIGNYIYSTIDKRGTAGGKGKRKMTAKRGRYHGSAFCTLCRCAKNGRLEAHFRSISREQNGKCKKFFFILS